MSAFSRLFTFSGLPVRAMNMMIENANAPATPTNMNVLMYAALFGKPYFSEITKFVAVVSPGCTATVCSQVLGSLKMAR